MPSLKKSKFIVGRATAPETITFNSKENKK